MCREEFWLHGVWFFLLDNGDMVSLFLSLLACWYSFIITCFYLCHSEEGLNVACMDISFRDSIDVLTYDGKVK